MATTYQLSQLVCSCQTHLWVFQFGCVQGLKICTLISHTAQSRKRYGQSKNKNFFLKVINREDELGLVDMSEVRDQKNTTMDDPDLFQLYDRLDERSRNMKSLFKIDPELVLKGPIVLAEVYPDRKTFIDLKNAKADVDHYTIKLLIDTGADKTSLDIRIIKKLNLIKGNEATVIGHSNESALKNQYDCLLYMGIFKTIALPINVLDHNYEGQNVGFDGVLGRDLLKYFSFVYDGWNSTFKLTSIKI